MALKRLQSDLEYLKMEKHLFVYFVAKQCLSMECLNSHLLYLLLALAQELFAGSQKHLLVLALDLDLQFKKYIFYKKNVTNCMWENSAANCKMLKS